MNTHKKQWEASYQAKDNFVFYPHEEVIRFVSKYIRKRIGLKEFKDVHSLEYTPKILDLGCGIGRHIIYGSKMGLETYGIDLSETAVEVALRWTKEEQISNAEEKIKQGDICKLPWPEDYFDFVISHGVLDSMPFEIAQTAMKEVARIVRKQGLFYCDLVSGNDNWHGREYAGEEIVETAHEQGTIQSYFNYSKINELINGYFEAVEGVVIKRENIFSADYISRYHLVLRRK